MRLFALLFLVLASCQTVDSSLRSKSGEKLSDLDPLPYRIVVAPIEDMPKDGFESKDKLKFTANNAELQDLLVAVLDPDLDYAKDRRVRSQRAVNGATSLPADAPRQWLLAAREQGADLIVVPRVVEDPVMAYGKINGRWPTTTLLWFFTWIGGHFVQDRQYTASMSLEFEVVNPYDGSVIATYVATSRTMDADVLDRSDGRFFTWQTALTLLIPGYWVPDNKSDSSNSLTSRVAERLAAQFTGYLKQEFAQSARKLTGTIYRANPANNATVSGTSFEFSAELIADRPITEITVFAPGEAGPTLLRSWSAEATDPEGALLPPEKQASVGIYRHPIRIPEVAIQGEDTWVRVEFAVQGRFASQTFRFRRAADPR